MCVWEQLILAWFRSCNHQSITILFYLHSHSVEIARANLNFSRCDEYHHKNPSNTPATTTTALAVGSSSRSDGRNAVSFLFCSFRSWRAYNCQICFYLLSIHMGMLQYYSKATDSLTHTRSHSRQMTTVRVRFTLPFAIFERNSLCALSESQCVKFMLTTFASTVWGKRNKNISCCDHPQWLTHKVLNI